MLRATLDDLNACLRDPTSLAGELPVALSHGLTVVSLDERHLTMHVAADSYDRGARGVVSGPVQFSLVDTVGWLVTIAHHWPDRVAVTTDLSMQFLRPAQQGDLVVEATALRIGRRCVIDVNVDTAGDAGPAAHAVVTFAPVR